VLDWYQPVTPPTPSPIDYRWGNGVALYTRTNGGWLHSNGSTYQDPEWTLGYTGGNSNNPCPSGWRVPTQEDWERLSDYNGNPSSATAGTISGDVTQFTSTGLTWVKVKCNANGCFAAPWSTTEPGGFAVYTTSVWNAAGSGYKPGAATPLSLAASGAPMPIVFLPAAGSRGNTSTSTTPTNVGVTGRYWTSTISSTEAMALGFSATGTDLSLSSGWSRANGYSVRCVQITP